MICKNKGFKTIHWKELLPKKALEFKFCDCNSSTSFPLSSWEKHWCSFGNFFTFSCLFKSNNLKISHSYSRELSSYLPVKFKLLDLSGPRPPVLFPRTWSPAPGTLFMLIFLLFLQILRSFSDMKGTIRTLSNIKKLLTIFIKWPILDIWQGSGYGSLFETKKFIVLNSVTKTQKIEKCCARAQGTQLVRPHV